MRQLALSITFPRSSSHHFSEVLEEASSERTFVTLSPDTGKGSPVTDSKTERYRVSYTLDNLQRYRSLWGKVRLWQGVLHQLDGLTVPFDSCQEMLDCTLSGRELGSHSWCWGESQGASSVGAMAPLFPCRFIPISEGNHLGWFLFGKLNKDRVFVVDKIQLRRRIDYYLEQTCAHLCPLLDATSIDTTIAALPNRIDPRIDESWVYRQGWIRGRYQMVGVEKRQLTARSPVERPAAARVEAPQPRTSTQSAEIQLIDGRVVPKVTYQDIGGLDPIIALLREAVELPIKLPQLFAHLGISPHRGVLLYGPSGTGKTLLAKALANECEAHFLLVNGPELISKWHGETEANLRRIFDEARRLAPSVILFDEIDALTPARDAVTHNFEAVQVSQLLALMDGLVERGNVVVIGTTNRPNSVDPALRRPGRLDLQLKVGLPNATAREAILRIHSERMPLEEGVCLKELAKKTPKYTGAMLAAVCREAGMACLREQLSIGTGAIPEISEAQIQSLKVTRAHFLGALKGLA